MSGPTKPQLLDPTSAPHGPGSLLDPTSAPHGPGSLLEPILEVRFFQTIRGNEPVRDWLKALHKDDRKRIGEDIKTAQFGWPLGMPLVRKLEKNLWEVRTDITDGIARTLFTVIGKQMVLLHAFVKKSQKTPKAELETARKRLKLLEDT